MPAPDEYERCPRLNALRPALVRTTPPCHEASYTPRMDVIRRVPHPAAGRRFRRAVAARRLTGAGARRPFSIINQLERAASASAATEEAHA